MNKFLIYSSIGNSYDKALLSWFKNDRKYDIIFVYYGNDNDRLEYLKKYCDYIFSNKGSKYQNLVFLSENINFNSYDYIWVVDDDIELESSKINELFYTAKKYNLSICQPSTSSAGKLSFKHLKQKKRLYMVYTNFIEVACPLFRIDSLKKLINIIKPFVKIDNKNIKEHSLNIPIKQFSEAPDYNDVCICGSGIKYKKCRLRNKCCKMKGLPLLKDWGIDFIMTALIFNENDPFAIIHDIVVLNPEDDDKLITNVNQARSMGLDNIRKRNWRLVKDILKIKLNEKEFIRIFNKVYSYHKNKYLIPKDRYNGIRYNLPI